MSPYSGYNGQMRSSVYQPTELALITKGGGNVSLREAGCCVALPFNRPRLCSQSILWLAV